MTIHKIPRLMIPCACGCGGHLPNRDEKGNKRKYLLNHQRSTRESRERTTHRKSRKGTERIPWNKGRSYVFTSKLHYANKASWNKAMRRLFMDECMRCAWKEAPCDTHHINPKAKGGRFSIENGIILCPNCHRLAHAHVISQNDLRKIRDAAKKIGVGI